MFIVNANLTKKWDSIHKKDEWEANSKFMERPKVFGSVQLSNTLPVNVNKTLTKTSTKSCLQPLKIKNKPHFFDG